MADFTYKPDFGYKVIPRFNTITKKYASGVDQVRLVGTKKLRTFEMSFNNRTKAERDAVIAFYDSKYGATIPFTISIDGEDILGRFIEESLSMVRINPNVYSYSFQFEEIA